MADSYDYTFIEHGTRIEGVEITSYDSNGNLHTGEWIFGHTKEEFDELWHEIN